MTKPVKAVTKQVRKHPAETGGLSLAAVVGAMLGLFKIDLDPLQVSSLVILVGAVPLGITKLVDWWRGRKAEIATFAPPELDG